jgi:hypothetical protein
MNYRNTTRLAAVLPLLVLTIGIALPAPSDDLALAEQLAQELLAACPLTASNDERARDASADRLTHSILLRDRMADPFFWGPHRAGTSYDPADSSLTRFNPFVWRRMYLSLLMFEPGYRIERVGSSTLLHMPVRFRNGLDPGSYPYPFWHSNRKWESWQFTTEILFLLEEGQVLGAYRSEQEDRNRSLVPRKWDGHWQWTGPNGETLPRAALYTYLFSPSNPHVTLLGTAYRALEAEARAHACFVCHSPSNSASMNPLRLLNFPNQALTERHAVVQQLEANLMPPNEGIPDEAERKKMLALAEAFAATGDQALDYEREFQPGN